MPRETPMMKQYARIKAENRDAILLFRMGDFYEMFFNDAAVASKVLGLALTTRDKDSKNPIPLAGIPHHALETYLARLVAAGHKVAICDQVEDPREAKGLVKREITEVITPGTVLSSSMLDARRSNFLVSVVAGKERAGLARVDPSTGEFLVSEMLPGELRMEILRAEAAEIIVPQGQSTSEPLASLLKQLSEIPVTHIDDWEYGLKQATDTLCEHFRVANLDGFGVSGLDEGLRAAGAAIRYLRDLKRRDLKQISTVRRLERADHMVLDETTQRNLELVVPMERGAEDATLLHVLDRTVTAMGARLIRGWIQYPLLDLSRIQERLDGVEDLSESQTENDELRLTLAELCDLARAIGRVDSGHAGPRELVSIRRSAELVPEIRQRLGQFRSDIVASLRASIPNLDEVARTIREAIVDTPPPSLRDTGIVRDGHDAELDGLRSIARDGKSWIGRLQSREREATGIPNLKVGYNKVFGYYVEVTKTHLHLVPERFTRKQTLVNAERFVTPELKEYEAKILTAEEDIARIEREIFERTREEVAEASDDIQRAASALASLDVLSSLAVAAVENRYVRPDLDESSSLTIRDGRHPVVERLLDSERFVPNDAHLDVNHQQIVLLTGPNMAGKSTYLRQVALIAVMAQMGSFVPAASASIGLVDRIFTRIGATDSLARGRSTFLVEMSETANILNNASSRSLILLDEIGRGTSTFDGLSLAWAVTEYLHNRAEVTPRTLFATHYHELTELEDILTRVKNMNVLVRETGDTIAFLRKVVAGAADQSYGIEVARLAGIPNEVIVRAREILANLESSQHDIDSVPRLAGGEHGPLASAPRQISFFEHTPSAIESEIAELDLDGMTPLDALHKLVEYRKRVENDE